MSLTEASEAVNELYISGAKVGGHQELGVWRRECDTEEAQVKGQESPFVPQKQEGKRPKCAAKEEEKERKERRQVRKRGKDKVNNPPRAASFLR